MTSEFAGAAPPASLVLVATFNNFLFISVMFLRSQTIFPLQSPMKGRYGQYTLAPLTVSGVQPPKIRCFADRRKDSAVLKRETIVHFPSSTVKSVSPVSSALSLTATDSAPHNAHPHLGQVCDFLSSTFIVSASQCQKLFDLPSIFQQKSQFVSSFPPQMCKLSPHPCTHVDNSGREGLLNSLRTYFISLLHFRSFCICLVFPLSFFHCEVSVWSLIQPVYTLGRFRMYLSLEPLDAFFSGKKRNFTFFSEPEVLFRFCATRNKSSASLLWNLFTVRPATH